jgi:transglutaminase-like putative cysteine protease
LGLTIGVLLAACAAPTSAPQPKVQTGGASSGGASSHDARVVHIEMRYRIEAPGETDRARFLLLVPRTLPGRQTALSFEWILPPTHTYQRTGGIEAEWIFDDPKGSFELGCVLSLELHPSDLNHPPAAPETDPVVLDTYLRDEAFIEKHSPRVARAARELAPKNARGLTLLRPLFEGTLFELENHGFKRTERGANRALKMGGGDCTDFADVLVALCRARGLPARHIRGFLARPFGPKDTPKHSWAEVHLEGSGWVRVDPFLAKLEQATLTELPNDYIQLSCSRNEEVENFWRYWYWGDPVAVTETLDLGYGTWTETVTSLPRR